MRILQSLRRVRSFLNNEADVELDEELRFHLERQIEENLANGMSPEVAQRTAMLEFGSVTQVTEQCYEARGFTWLHDLLQDLRYGVGMLIKNRAFACATILVLAMGIGACTAIFSLVNAVLVRSLPYGNAGQLVYLFTPIPHLNLPPEVFGPSYADILDIQKQSHSYTGITTFSQHAYNLASQEPWNELAEPRWTLNSSLSCRLRLNEAAQLASRMINRAMITWRSSATRFGNLCSPVAPTF